LDPSGFIAAAILRSSFASGVSVVALVVPVVPLAPVAPLAPVVPLAPVDDGAPPVAAIAAADQPSATAAQSTRIFPEAPLVTG
jgi:hypothetical protein